MTARPSYSACLILAVLVGTACSHSSVDLPNPPSVGPSGSGPDIRLTVNAEQDYWPAWTADGRGVLYSFVNQAPDNRHRCIGLLPAAGGTRIWELCDNRGTEVDSVNSFPAYALATDGRLLYVEAEAPSGPQSLNPASSTLWLADTAAPFARRALATLPVVVSGQRVDWLIDLNWTSPTEFTALAAEYSANIHCKGCTTFDSLFTGVAVLHGSIGAEGASLTLVPGTDGASNYSNAESGTSIVFSRHADPHLYEAPAIGGIANAIATLGSDSLLGVSCQASTCVVAEDPVTLIPTTSLVTFFGSEANPGKLWSVSLVTGATNVVWSDATAVLATPLLSPSEHDVVAQRGGLLGHLRTDSSPASDLHLFPGLIP
jgi:hypothetical protein